MAFTASDDGDADFEGCGLEARGKGFADFESLDFACHLVSFLSFLISRLLYHGEYSVTLQGENYICSA